VSRRLGARPAAVAVLLVPALAAVTLSGCAAGTDALTSHARTTTDSVSAALGTISLRNIYLAGPADQGGSAQIVSAFFNGGVEPDSITGISSPLAAGGVTPPKSVIQPGGGTIYIANGAAPALTGLKQNLMLGQTVPVTFTFAKAGSITVLVPVETPAPGASAPAASSPAASSPAASSPTGFPTASTSASAPPSGAATPSAGVPTGPTATPTG
jgi:copper(I)-binding protein